MKKVLRLTGNKSLLKKEQNFKDSALKVGDIDIDFLCYFDLYYHNGFKHIKNGEKLFDYDIYWIGGAKGVSFLKGFAFKIGKLEGKNIIDKQKLTFLLNDKFSQVLFCEHYSFNIPNTLFFISSEENFEPISKILESNLKYPFIAKEPDIDRGDGVFLIKNKNELIELLKQNIDKGIIFQEKIENNGDYRVITIGDKVLGAMKRYNPNDYRNNVSKGGKSENAYIPNFLKDISIDINKKYDMSISGIDYFIDKNNNYYIIEINELPEYDGYNGFEETTGTSYSLEVMKYFKNYNENI